MPVKNMPGGSATIAADYVVRQPADGYTVWAMTATDLPINLVVGRSPHPLASYIPIAMIQKDIGMLQVLSKRFNNIDEVVEYAKRNPLRVGGSGAIAHDEVMVAAWASSAGIEVIYVPYERAGDMHAALLGGHVHVLYEELGPVAGLIAAGTVKPVLAFSSQKIRGFPDIPLAPEKGWNITLPQWRGLMVKAGTPPEIVEKLRNTFEQAILDPEYKTFERERFLDLVPGYHRGDDFLRSINMSIELYRNVLRQLGHVK
jgi:tripartite-type tricarboxylate transporter receptor subunit TctC